MKDILTAGCAAALLWSTPVSAQTEIVFNMYLAPNNEIVQSAIYPWAEAVEAATEGRVKIAFTASSLAPPPRQLDMVRNRVADAAINLSAFTREQWAAPLIGELPGLFENGRAEDHSRALWRTYEQFFREAESLDGVEVISLFSLTGNHVWNNTRPFTQLSDLAGVKLRVNPNGADIIAALDAVVISRPAAETYELVSRGVVDGTVIPTATVTGQRVEGNLRYGTITPVGLYRSTAGIVMNADVWAGLNDEDREAIRSVSGEVLAISAGAKVDDADTVAMEAILAAGVEIHHADESLIAAIAERARALGATEAWIERVNAMGVDGRAALDFYIAELGNGG
jgi:TRAP-type C4-dicarboxylate transport system substrate-binding protein